jgi:mannose-1-phosphate guanylyltransferase
MSKAPFHAVILAGGRGTRFWPRSRKKTPKQLLPFHGSVSLLQETVVRLSPLIPPERTWILTNRILAPAIRRQLPAVPRHQVIAEPVQRNTAPAIALAARLILQQDPSAVMGVFPSDHLIAKPKPFLQLLSRAVRAAQDDALVVLGLEPRWAETGYGYIEFPKGTKPGGAVAVPVTRFREKPDEATAMRFLKAGRFFWNSGMFVWKAETIDRAIKELLPRTAAVLSALPDAGSRDFRTKLRRAYPQCDDISIDYGVLEHAANIVGFPSKDFGWNDIGSWQAAYELGTKNLAGNVAHSPIEALDATGNYVDAAGKFVALVGVHDLVVVDTPDALLICPRAEAQKISALVKALELAGWDALL